MTLVEVIVAIALLGIISTGFLGVFGSNLNFININKKNTEDIFVTQRQMELAIETAKNDSGLTYTTLTNVFEAGINVKVHQMSHSNGNDTFYTLISDTRLPELRVPVVESVTATLRSNTTPVTSAYAIASTNVQGNFVMDPTTMDVFMVNTFQWYVSRSGFNIPVPASYPEIEAGTKYPMFPDDYTIIPGATGTNLNNVTAYAGKHLVFAVSPAANSGKIGVTVPSKPVFISGLPVISSDLMLHLDGTQIDATDNTQVSSGKVLKWNDLSTYNIPATQASDANRPNLIDQGIAGEFIGKQVDFASGKTLNVAHTHLNAQTLHVFAVVKGDAAGNFMVNGGQSIPTTGDAIGNGWVLSYSTYTANSNTVTLGNTDVDIAELLIYRGALTTEQIEAISKYLKEKYVPIDMIGEIVSLYNFSAEVMKNTPYSAPSAVKADMAFGNDRYVPVTWVGGSVIDTSVAGIFTFIGKAVSDPTKEVTLTLTVKEPILVQSVSVTPTSSVLYKDNMVTLIATVLPVDAAEKSVTWSSSAPSIASVDSTGVVTAKAAGTAVITCTTVEGSKTATSTITVLAVDSMPTGMVLNLDAHYGVTLTGGYVSTWADQSGNDNHFTQSTSDNRPGYSATTINNRPGITFNPSFPEFLTRSDSDLSGVKMFTSGATEFTLFVVGSSNTRGSGTRSSFFSQYINNGQGSSFTLSRLSNGQFANSTLQNTVLTTAGNSSLNLHTTIYNSSTLIYRLNQSLVGSTGSVNIASQNGSLFRVGAGNSSNSTSHALDGKIGEIIVFNRTLNAAELDYVENYLYDKWFKNRAISWEFNTSADRLLAKANINNSSTMDWYSPGQIGGSITGNDPYFYLPELSSGANINLNTNKIIKVRLKNETPATHAQFYFSTYQIGEGGMDETKVITFPIIPNSDFVEYTVDMSSIPKWTGLLRQLRFDPAVYPGGFTGPYGSFQVDYIRIIE